MHTKCDLEQKSKHVLEIWNLRRATYEKEYETKIMNKSNQGSKSHGVTIKPQLAH